MDESEVACVLVIPPWVAELAEVPEMPGMSRETLRLNRLCKLVMTMIDTEDNAGILLLRKESLVSGSDQVDLVGEDEDDN